MGVLGFAAVDFVEHQHHRHMFGQLADNGAVGLGKAHGFDDEGNGIDAGERFGYV